MTTSNVTSPAIARNATKFHTENATSVSTYENRNYRILIPYPSDWSIQGSTASGTPINIATFVSPTGPNSNPTADVSI